MPAELVPVVDMLFERDDLRPRNGLRPVQPRQQIVGRRATRTAFAGEQFDDHRSPGIVGKSGRAAGGKRQGEETKSRHTKEETSREVKVLPHRDMLAPK